MPWRPVAQRGGRLLVFGGGGHALHPIAQLLGASDHEHEAQSRARQEAARAGRDFYRIFYRTG